MTVSLVVFASAIGLAVGSFLNVVAWRVPRGESIVTPRSHCPNCSSPLRATDTVPVVSWLVLKGRCRFCGTSIPFRYPALELVTGALFAGIALRFGLHWNALIEAVFVTGLIALAVTDFEHLVLPKRIVYADMVLLVSLMFIASVSTAHFGALVSAAVCAATWYALFFAIHRVRPHALGFGDVRFASLLGLGLGWLSIASALLGFVLAGLVGSIIGISLLALRLVDRKTPLPFGVFLSLGAIAAIYLVPVGLRGA